MSTGLYINKAELADNPSAYLLEYDNREWHEDCHTGKMVQYGSCGTVLVLPDAGYSRVVSVRDNGDIYISVGYKAVAELCYDLDQAGVAWEEIG